MGKKLKAAALVSAFIVISPIAGCSEKEEHDVVLSKGGYVETVMKADSNVYSLSEVTCISNNLMTYDSMFCKEYVISDTGQELHSTDSTLLNKLKGSNGHTNLLASSDSGYLISKNSSDGYGKEYYTVSADGEEKKVDTSDYIVDAEFSDDGRLFIVNGTALCEIMANNSVKQLISVGQNIIAMDIIGDDIIIVDEKGVHIYSIKEENELEAPKALSDFFEKYINASDSGDNAIDMCKAPNDSIYIACSDGIFKYILNGNNVEQIIDGVTCSLGNPSLHLSSVYCFDDSSIVVVFNEGTVCRYVYDADMENEQSQVLKVYSLEKNELFSQMINGFAAQNKGIKIDYQVGMKDGIGYEDAMKDFTTQVLSGNAPDLIMLDGLDIDNYIDKNMLCDLSAYDEICKKDGKLLDNIVQWNKKGDKVYNVACKFSIPAIGADSNELNKLNNFEDIAAYIEENRKKYNSDIPITYFGSPDYIIKTGLIYEGSNMISGGQIDREKLKKFYDNCAVIFRNNENKDLLISSGSSGDEAAFSARMQSVISDDHTLAIGTVNTFDYDLNTLESLDSITPDNNADYKFGTGNSDKVFLPKCNLGIIEAGKNHDAAKEFIAYALDSETQKLAENIGFPVNTDTLEYLYKKNENDINNFYGYELTSYDESKTFVMDIKWISNKQAKEFGDYIRTLDTPYIIDKATEQVIVETGSGCMNGSVSAEEAADKAVKQLELKMKE